MLETINWFRRKGGNEMLIVVRIAKTRRTTPIKNPSRVNEEVHADTARPHTWITIRFVCTRLHLAEWFEQWREFFFSFFFLFTGMNVNCTLSRRIIHLVWTECFTSQLLSIAWKITKISKEEQAPLLSSLIDKFFRIIKYL